jgi:hypothetical protein
MTTTGTEIIYPYYSIVAFGRPGYGVRRTHYRSATAAVRDAQGLGGGSLSDVRVVGCASRAAALGADIASGLPVVWRR